MKILAFDSTAKAASVAVCEDAHPLAHYTIDNGLTQSELLLPMAENMLKSLGLGFDDIDLYACAAGPGSFTGVRIGVSLIKGLAFGKGKPCVAVSTIESLAQNLSGVRGLVVPVMDARRSQVYTALFQSDAEKLTRLTEDMAISIDTLAALIKEREPSAVYLSGDGYDIVREKLTSLGINPESTPRLLHTESAYSCAQVALNMYKAGNYTSDLEIAPTYLRMPQAERERLERLNTLK